MSSASDVGALNIDLWPKAKFETDIVTPVSIMRRQAALLGEKTQQLLTAEVHTSTNGGLAAHYFRLVVPTMDNYKYQLFYITHPVEQIYPLEAYFEGANPTIRDQTGFVYWLKGVLSSESTLKRSTH